MIKNDTTPVSRIIYLAILLQTIFLLLPSLVSAAAGPMPAPIGFNAPVTALKTGAGTAGSGTVWDLFCSIIGWWLFFTMGLSIIMGVWAGWKMVLNSEKGLNQEARHMLQYALIGVAIGMIALGIPLIAGSFLGVEASACSFGTPSGLGN